MKKLKIIQTPARFYPHIGGVEKYVYDLSYQLVKNGIDVKVICAKEPKKLIKSINGIKINKLNYVGKIANTNITLGLFSRLLNEEFDLIHTHIPTPWSADISLLVSFIKRKPLILTYHNDLEKSGKTQFVAKLYNIFFLKLLFTVSKKIIVTNPEYINKSKYLKGFENKIIVIPNGVNKKNFSYISTIKKKNNQIFFLSVLDNYHLYKGLIYLLRAIPEVKKIIPDIKLLIGGNGALINEYKKLTQELDIIENVTFLGYVSDKRLIRLYRESNIFILPSIDTNEGFGIVLLEAMAQKTAVIATSITGVAKDIKAFETGYIIPPKNSSKLAGSIISLLQNKELALKMGENGKRLVEKKYNWRKIAKQIEGVYKNV